MTEHDKHSLMHAGYHIIKDPAVQKKLGAIALPLLTNPATWVAVGAIVVTAAIVNEVVDG